MTKISDQRRKGSATIVREYGIGYMNCEACGAETPDPPQHVLDHLAKIDSHASTVWPCARERHGDPHYWVVPGWLDIDNFGMICDRCTRAVMTLLRGRRVESNTRANDLEIAERVIAKATALTYEGLLSAFPPPSKTADGTRGGYKSPDGKRWYQFPDDYKAGELRQRIREIHNVLLGKLPQDEEAKG